MKKLAVLSLLTSLIFTSCKKSYNCECFNPGGIEKTYVIKDTKKRAKEKCADYSKEYQNVPWSESGCVLK